MIEGRRNANVFRSEGGRGEWIIANSLTAGFSAGNVQQIEIPKTLSADYKQRGWNGAVVAMGVRIRGVHTADVGAQTVRVSKHQVLSHYDVLINCNMKYPYTQQREDLARWAYVGMAVNARAEMLDQEFVDDGERPLRGIVPANVVSPDVGIAGNDAKPLVTQNGSNYPGTDRLDSMWRQFEGLTTIAEAEPNAGEEFDFFQSIPLCAYTGSLLRDSIPLDTLCDLNRPWNLSFRVARDPASSFCKVAGTWTTQRVDLYLYVIPTRDSDPRMHGFPYILRRKNRGQSPLQYEPGEVVLFTGNFPLTGVGAETFTDTVNGQAYSFMVVHGNYCPDFMQGNTLDWAATGAQARFPYWYKNRNPRHVVDSVWNARRDFHQLRYGASDEVVVRAGRAIAGLGYAPVVDSANLTTLLGTVSPFPVRVLGCSALEFKGFPGFGALTRDCGTPFIELTGTINYGGGSGPSAINGQQGMTDIILNNSDEDRIYIEDLGRGCCKDGSVVFAPTATNPESPKADIVAGKLTTFEEVKPDDKQDMAKVKTNANAAAVGNIADASAVLTLVGNGAPPALIKTHA